MSYSSKRVLGQLAGASVLVFGFIGMAWIFEGLDVSSLWLSFIGGFHPVLLHLPIGIWFVVAACAVLPTPRIVLLTLWWMSALSATLAFGTGFLLGAEGGYDEALLGKHLWAAAVFSGLCWIGLWTVLSGRKRIFHYAVLTASGLAMLIVGHYGGVMVHGDPLAAAPWRLDPQQYATLPAFGDEVRLYEDLVTPIMGAKCVSCHGAAKQKGRLRLDSLEAILKGSKEGLVVRPGDVAKSSLVSVIGLPIRHDEHMPPRGHPQVSAIEFAVLKFWIDSGAREEIKIAIAEVPESFAAIFEDGYRLLPDKEEERLRLIAEAEMAEREYRERLRLETLLHEVPKEFASGFYFISADSARLVFNRFGSAPLDTEAWNAIEPLLQECTDINLSGMEVEGEWIASLSDSEKLKRLNLSESSLGDTELAQLTGSNSLTSLNLFNTQIISLSSLDSNNFPELESLFVGGNQLRLSEIEALKRRLPDCRIVGDVAVVGAAKEPPVEQEGI